ncbi:MAG: hypothetical protein KGL95_06255 [Patescibacteria group bacterium]|nr:hypothetical protein [Patescibacteria group bacterium]
MTYDITEKIKRAIEHIGIKDSSQFQDYFRGGVIYYSTIEAYFREELLPTIKNADFVKNEMISNGLDYLIFKLESASINGIPSSNTYPTLTYVKNDPLSQILAKSGLEITRL